MPDEQAQPEAQFPAPRGDYEDAVEEIERLAAPSEAAQLLMAEHLRKHGIEAFKLDAHVYLGPPRLASQLLTWDPGRARFECEQCPGLGFWTGEITSDWVFSTQLFDQGLRPFLAGPHTAETRDEITHRYLTGELTRGLLRASGKAKRRRAAADARPMVAHYKIQVQRWMLKRYTVRGVFERVVEEAATMQEDDIETWLTLAGKRLAPSTLRRYWQELDDELVEAAQQAHIQLSRS
jgi:hypothetical protein